MSDIAELVARAIPRLRRYARALTGDANRADDLVQDALERAWSRIHLWRDETGDIRPWLFAILHNVHANAARRHQRGPEFVPLPDDEETPATHPSSPEADLELRDLRDALLRVPEEQRQVLLLIGMEQLSYQEVADILGLPMGTVMSRLFRGRERLRVLLRGGPRTHLKRVT